MKITMKLFLQFVLFIIFFNELPSKNISVQNVQSTSLIETKEIEPDTADSKKSDSYLAQVYSMAKNISHSKHVNPGNEVHQLKEVRRSVLRKQKISSEVLNLRDILDKLVSSSENQLKILQDLELLVHQYDVAVNFASMGGIKFVEPLLFSSDENVASYVAILLGAAMQSNPIVQKIAMEENLTTKLINMLSHKSPDVVSRVIFALSCLVRNFFEAQEEFVSENGIYKLSGILNNPHITTSTKLKIVNLFNDLALELEYCDNEDLKDRRSAFKRLFSEELLKYGICKNIPVFLSFEDYDTHQRVIEAMSSLLKICYEDFDTGETMNRLYALVKLYSSTSTYESEWIRPVYHEISVINGFRSIEQVVKRLGFQPLENGIKSNGFHQVQYHIDQELKSNLLIDLLNLIRRIEYHYSNDSAYLVKKEL